MKVSQSLIAAAVIAVLPLSVFAGDKDKTAAPMGTTASAEFDALDTNADKRISRAEASRDTIRHFTDAVGDHNPLYRDEEYATNSCYGTLIAPPCFLYSVCWATGRVGFPGM